MSKLIYIADDDDNIRSLIEMFLKSDGYEVIAFNTGDKLYEEFEKKHPDLIVLDIMMPGSDGLTICNKIRRMSTVPIILLTAKDSDVDQINGLTLGSDDYITKPFKPTLLNVRVKALLRRADMANLEITKKRDEVSFGDLSYNSNRHAVLCKGEEVKLTQTELNCITYMLNNCENAISREDLLKDVWGYDYAVETRAVDETVRRIRKKLLAKGSNVNIANKWGYGYILKIEVKI